MSTQTEQRSGDRGAAGAETLTVTDNRTGQTFEIPISDGTVRAMDFRQVKDAELRHIQIIRMLAKMPTLAAFSYRHNMGQPYVYPDNDLSYAGNFLSMMYKMTELKYEPDPRVERALDVLFILHADHEQNCSTNAVRSVG